VCGTPESRLVWALFERPVILRAQDQVLALSLTTKTRRSVGEALEQSLQRAPFGGKLPLWAVGVLSWDRLKRLRQTVQRPPSLL
jgi:hypothetical protein